MNALCDRVKFLKSDINESTNLKENDTRNDDDIKGHED